MCVGHNFKLLDIVKNFGPLSENSSLLLVSQAGYGPGVQSMAVFHLKRLLALTHELRAQGETSASSAFQAFGATRLGI